MRDDLPAYTSDYTKLKPGMYLGLFHGRTKPDQDMTDWGFHGPVIGPLEFVHTTYASEVKLQFTDPEDFRRYFPKEDRISGFSAGPNLAFMSEMSPGPVIDSQKLADPGYLQEAINRGYVKEVYENRATRLSLEEDLLVYEGEFYGDWTVFVIGNVMPTAKQIADEIGRAR